jgi:uncharacterized delta-60 repeat protein
MIMRFLRFLGSRGPMKAARLQSVRAISVGLLAAALGGVQLAAAGPAQAAAGDLDPSFGTGGIVTTNVSTIDIAQAVAVQADGKIVAAGSSTRTSPPGFDQFFSVARYNPDGTPDTSFGTSGVVTADLGIEEEADALAVQPDGKILAGGTISGNFALLRYNPDGTLDTTFGTGGEVTTDFGGHDTVTGLAVLPSGKLVAAGFTSTSVNSFALARYEPNGTLDTTFGTDGTVTTSITGNDHATALAVQPSGKLVVAGFSVVNNGEGEFVLARYDRDGALDTGFGTGGTVTTAFAGSASGAHAVVAGPDGKITAAGNAGGLALARYNRNGTLDNTFGTGGEVVTSAGERVGGASALVLDGNELVAAGSGALPGSGTGFGLARFNPDGTLDTTFGSGGAITTSIGTNSPPSASAQALAVQPDGKLIAAGEAVNTATHTDFALARYLP